MKDDKKTKEELVAEVSDLRQQVDELKTSSTRKSGGGEVERKLKFAKTVCDVSSRFVGVLDIDSAIAASLEDIGKTTGADRVYVFLLDEDGNTMSNTHEWAAAGVSSEKDNLQNLAVDTFPWSMGKLRDGDTVHVPDVSALPEKASAEKEILQAQDIKSLLIFPIQSGDEFMGFMGLDNVKETGAWSEDHFELLRVSAKIVSDGLLHVRVNLKLQQQAKALGERVKELHCLFAISQLFENTALSLQGTIQGVVDLIPKSWQYPEVACARIVLNEQVYKTENFRETEWKQLSEIKIYGAMKGMVEVFYLEKKPDCDEGPFVSEERALIDAIARRLGRLSERKQTELALLESESKNRALLTAIPDMMFQINRNGIFLDFITSKEIEPIVEPERFIGKSVHEVLPQVMAQQTMVHVKRVLQTKDTQVYEYQLPTPFPDGNLRDYEARLVASGEDEVLAIVRDITEKKKAEDKLRVLATTDSLTEVLNRRSGLLLLRKQLALAKRSNTVLSICYTDINNLKEINDTYGHREGDEVLRIVSRILREEVRESDTISRLGGDEFLIILPECPIAKAEEVWLRIAARLKALNAIKMNPYKIHVSHGFADFEPANPSSLDEMLIVADFEMYKDKRSGSGAE